MQCPNGVEHEMEVADGDADIYAFCLDCGATLMLEGEWLDARQAS